MTEGVAGLGAVLAWLGASILVLSHARRGVALGLALAAAGVGIAVAAQADLVAGATLVAGGLASAALRLRDGAQGWGILPPGSTPRLILCLVAGAAAYYMGTVLTGGDSPFPAVAALAVSGLSAARILGSELRQSSLAGAAALGLGLGALEAVGAGGSAVIPAAVAGAAAALVFGLVPAGGVERAT